MPRPRRVQPAGVPFHIINRGNDRRQLFFEEADYQGFVAWLAEAKARYPVAVLAYVVMPNHFHLILTALEDQAISAYMHWLQCRSCRDFREVTQTYGHGHILQRRYWSRPLHTDHQYVIALKYVEGNALRAGLTKKAEDWRWCSLYERCRPGRAILAESPVPLPPPEDWAVAVNLGLEQGELRQLLQGVRKGRPSEHLRNS